MKLEDFFTSYSQFDVESLYTHKEIFTYEQNSLFLKHQSRIANVLSPFTPFKEMLIIHEMGTGKTCTALAVAERYLNNISDYNMGVYSLNKIIIVTKSVSAHDVFIKDMMETCRFSKYENDNVRDTRLKIKKDFLFKTFETFTRELLNITDKKIKEKYEKSLIIVDEAHNIRKKQDNELVHCYSQIYRLFHVLRHRKIILLTGTPMKDSDVEIVHLFNLLLPEEKQMSDHVITNDNIQLFLDNVRLMYSFMKSGECNIVKKFIGEKKSLDSFITFNVKMSDFQSKVFHSSQKSTNQGIFFDPRQASCFVFPDGTYGNLSFNKYISKEDNIVEFNNNVDKADIKTNLERYSAKYFNLIKVLNDSVKAGEKSFIFCEFVNGSGILLLCSILKLFDFHQITSPDKIGNRRNSFVIITNETCSNSEIHKYLDRFNSPDNSDGKHISIIIGSRVMMETYTLKCVQHIHILTPHWNFSETSQIIGRGVRYGAHVDLPHVSHVNVYLYAAYCNCCENRKYDDSNLKYHSIDLYMYRMAERKDLKIQNILYKLKCNAFDCEPLKSKNQYHEKYDYSRECEYQKCEYKCNFKYKDGDNDVNQWLLTTSDVQHLQKEILSLFIDNNMQSMTCDFVFEKLRHLFINEYHFMKTLYSIIYSNTTIIKSIFGSFTFYEKDGLIYINNYGDSFKVPHLMDIYLPFNVKYKEIESFTSFLNTSAAIVQSGKENELVNCKSYEQFESTIVNLTLEYKESILMRALVDMCKKTNNMDKTLRDYILRYFKLVYLTNCSMAIQWFVQNKWKTFDGDSWRDSTDEECEMIKEFRNDRRKAIAMNEYGVFGFINLHNGIFCIRHSEDETDAVKDKRKIRVGKNCSTWHKPDLISTLCLCKINPFIVLDEETITSIYYKHGIDRNQSIDKILKISNLTKTRDIEDVINAFRDMKHYILLWNCCTVMVMCNILKTFLKTNGLIDEDYSCGTQLKVRA